MDDDLQMIAEIDRVEPVPRRAGDAEASFASYINAHDVVLDTMTSQPLSAVGAER